MDNEEFVRQLTETYERSKSNTHQIEEIKAEIKELKTEQKAIYDIATSVRVMSETMTNIKEDIVTVKEGQNTMVENFTKDIKEVKGGQQELTNKINDIEQQPAKKYDKLKQAVITSIITAIATGAIIAAINIILSNGIQI